MTLELFNIRILVGLGLSVESAEIVMEHITELEKERDRYRGALEKLLNGDHSGVSINAGSCAMRVIEDALKGETK